MQVCFKGTYAIIGDTILNNAYTNVSNFLSETKDYRKTTGKTFLNTDNFDYYVEVVDEKEKVFEQTAKKYKINMRRENAKDSYISIAGNCSSPECECKSILDAVINFYKDKK